MSIRVLGIAGSLRAGSFNRALLHAAADLAPAGMEIRAFAGLGAVPPYNPADPPAGAALAPGARRLDSAPRARGRRLSGSRRTPLDRRGATR